MTRRRRNRPLCQECRKRVCTVADDGVHYDRYCYICKIDLKNLRRLRQEREQQQREHDDDHE